MMAWNDSSNGESSLSTCVTLPSAVNLVAIYLLEFLSLLHFRFSFAGSKLSLSMLGAETLGAETLSADILSACTRTAYKNESFLFGP